LPRLKSCIVGLAAPIGWPAIPIFRRPLLRDAAALVSLGLAFASPCLVRAQTAEPDWPTADQMRPKPSTDTTPVTIQMLPVTYRIPRNYLTFIPR
jgi:hypothetical protein